MTVDPGDPAPDVTALNQHSESITPDFTNPTVIYFYPEDGTPGCSTEADQFQLEAETYREAGVDVYGVSTDDVDSHAEFAAAQGIEFDLLADPNGDVAAAFGLTLRDDGRVPRTTFVISDGEIASVYDKVRPDGHAREVLMEMLDHDVVSLD